MGPWIHLAPLQGVGGAAGWLILPERPAPALAAQIAAHVPRGRWRRLAQLGGWWLAADDATFAAMRACLGHTIPAGELCHECVRDGAPCDAAAARAMVNRGAARWAQGVMLDAALREAAARRPGRALPTWSGPPFPPPPAAWRPREERPRANPFPPPPRPAPPPDPLLAHAGVLGVAWPAGAADVKRAFRAKIVSVHPDLGGREADAVRVIAARDALLAAVAA